MVKIKYLGHAAFYIEGKNTSFMFDPFIENPLAVEKDLVEEFKKLNPNYLLITHGHWDHIGQAEYFINKGAKVIAIFELFNFLKSLNPKTEGFGMNIGGTINLNNLKITMVNALHSSSVIESGGKTVYLGEPTGFITEIDGLRVYHMGDTGLTKDFELVGELYRPDIVLIPIGSTFTMGLKEALKALEMIKPKIAIPMHYNTWPPIKQDPYEFKRMVEEKLKTEVVVMEVGEESFY
jgi:L-ascorbate metabolism protein UlaG (beta-lactamase superfamily)